METEAAENLLALDRKKNFPESPFNKIKIPKKRTYSSFIFEAFCHRVPKWGYRRDREARLLLKLFISHSTYGPISGTALIPHRYNHNHCYHAMHRIL